MDPGGLFLHQDWKGKFDMATTCFKARDKAHPWQVRRMSRGRLQTAYSGGDEQAGSWYGSLLDVQTDGSQNVYMRNRYYDPASGRFTQEDPIGLAGGLNLYGFALGDPVNYSDPLGLSALCIPCRLALAGGRAGAAAGGAAGTVVLGLGNGVGAVAGGVIGALTGVGIGVWLASKADDSWEGLSEDELKGKSTGEIEGAVPEDWVREPTRGEGGTRYKHPTNKGEQIRVMPGKPNDPDPVKRGPYVRISRDGRTSDPIPLKGNPTLQQ